MGSPANVTLGTRNGVSELVSVDERENDEGEGDADSRVDSEELLENSAVESSVGVGEGSVAPDGRVIVVCSVRVMVIVTSSSPPPSR